MPSNLPAPVNTGQVKACVFRVAALAPSCAPLGGDCSGYVGAGLVNYTADPQVEEGVERRPRNGCGRVLYTVKDDDIITSWNLSGEIAVWDPEMLVLMFGGQPILGAAGGDFAGDVIGWASPSPDSPARNGVYFEVIAEQVAEGAGDCVAAGAEYPPYVGDVWGKVRFTPGQITPQMITAQAEALASPGPKLAYCRSGNRSTVLWALARAGQEPVEELLQTAARAGYDLAGVRPLLESLARQDG